MVKTTKRIINRPIKELRDPVFPFKWTQAYVEHNINIISTFNINLDK